MMFKFNLQRFKGGTVTENVYEPTIYELQLQQLAVNYAEALAPNAHMLNDYAKEVIENSFRTVFKDLDYYYVHLAGEAQERGTQGLSGLMQDLPAEMQAALYVADTNLSGLNKKYQSVANCATCKQQRLVGALNEQFSLTGSSLSSIYDDLITVTDVTNDTLMSYVLPNSTAAQNANTGINSVISSDSVAADNYVKNLDSIAGSNISLTTAANQDLNNYISANSNAASLANASLGTYITENSNAAKTANDSLGSYRNQNNTDTSAANSVLGGFTTQNINAANSLSSLLGNYLTQNDGAATLVSSEIDTFIGQNTLYSDNYVEQLTGENGFSMQGDSATDDIDNLFDNYILAGDELTSLANEGNNDYIEENTKPLTSVQSAFSQAENLNTSIASATNSSLKNFAVGNDTITTLTADTLNQAASLNNSIVTAANPSLQSIATNNDAATSNLTQYFYETELINTAIADVANSRLQCHRVKACEATRITNGGLSVILTKGDTATSLVNDSLTVHSD
ncbi:MAG: hypothetical protein IJG32_08350, partial [Selenomonadaceae bacterium]|nr:hypothetical protein [Selenomonadaceae bacterium]